MDPVIAEVPAPVPLVLVPGLLCDAALWHPILAPLAAVRTVVIVDVTQDETIEAMAESVLDQAPPGRFAIAGLSMGGYVAMAVARKWAARVAGLAFLNTTARPDAPDRSDQRRQLIAMAKQGGFHRIPPLMLPSMVAPSRQADPSAGGVYLEMAKRVGADAFIRQQSAIIHRADSRPGLAAIDCPTLVIAGTLDLLTPPPVMQEVARLIAGATYIEIAGCGHLAPLEAPTAVLAAFGTWLAAVDDRAGTG